MNRDDPGDRDRDRHRARPGTAGRPPGGRRYLIASAVFAAAAVIVGLLLAAAPATTQSLVAVANVPTPSKQLKTALQAFVTEANSQHANLLLLVATEPRQAAAAADALSGYVPPRPRPAPSPAKTGKKHKNGKAGGHGRPAPAHTTTAGQAWPIATLSVDLASAAPSTNPGRPPTAVIFSPSGDAAVIGQLPASARVIMVPAGTVLRPGAQPGGRGLLVLVWACLLLGFSYLATRAIAVSRATPISPDGPAETSGTAAVGGLGNPSAPPRAGTGTLEIPGPPQPTPTFKRLRWEPPLPRKPTPPPQPPRLPELQPPGHILDGLEILARHQPTQPAERWAPQCPWCGSFSGPGDNHRCLSCGFGWPETDRHSWPDTVLSHRRQTMTADADRDPRE
jgi:hypothetical protein